MIRERVEIAPLPAASKAEPAGIAPTGGARSGAALPVFPGSGRDALDLPVDPLLFGPIRGYTLVRTRVTSSQPGVDFSTGSLVSETPGQPLLGAVEITRGTADGPEVIASYPLAPGWTYSRTYPIGDFNGSACGTLDLHYTEFSTEPSAVFARIPAYANVNARLALESDGCERPNSVTDWCPCYLARPGPVKWTRGFSIRSPQFIPIVPNALLVTPAPDTLSAGEASGLALRLIDAHGYEVRLTEVSGFDTGTPVTLTAPADSAAGRGLVIGGAPTASVTTTYGAARGGAVDYAAGADSLLYDTPVTVSATGGGYSGAGRLVLRGTAGAGPDSLVADAADPAVPCGDSTAVLLDGFLDGELRPLPDSARVTLTVVDSVRAAVSYGGTRARALTVPAVALRDSTVRLVTQNCDDVAGEVPLAVEVTVEAPWAEGGTLTTTLTVPLVPRDDALSLTFGAGTVLGPGEATQLSLGGAAPSDVIDLVLDETGEAIGELRDASTGQAGSMLFGVPASAFAAGDVTFVVHRYTSGPPTLADPPAGDAVRGEAGDGANKSTDDAPDLAAAGYGLPTVPAMVTATRNDDTAQATARVAPYGAAAAVSPPAVRLGQGATVELTITRAFEAVSPFLAPYLGPWDAVTMTPFGCAAALIGSEDPTTFHHPVFVPVTYGPTVSGLYSCAALTGSTRAFDLVGTHRASFVYPDEAEGVGTQAAEVYAGLAVRQGETWTWATALPGTDIGRPLTDSKQLAVTDEAVSSYACGGPQSFALTVDLRQAPHCTQFNAPGGQTPVPYADGVSTGALGKTHPLFNHVFDVLRAEFCVDPETDRWVARMPAPVLSQSWSTCPGSARAISDDLIVLTDETDPQITQANHEEIAERLGRLQGEWGTPVDQADYGSARRARRAAPRVSRSWLDSGTAAHERDGHAPFQEAVAWATLDGSLATLRQFVDREAEGPVVWGDIPSRELYQRGLAAMLDEVNLPRQAAETPAEARELLSAEVVRLIRDAGKLMGDFAGATTDPLHYRSYFLGAIEADRVRTAILSTYD